MLVGAEDQDGTVAVRPTHVDSYAALKCYRALPKAVRFSLEL